ncbi:head-tail adaptor protein [Streptomyces sp. NPDC096354]|uniref:head-tail adaptor protein n=1 Tax=Streptomyces sp. NPDC096354 TaxID=3366088 RepID=UPI00382B615E
MSARSLLNTQLSVWRHTRIPDGMGGWVDTVAVVSSERARISQPSATERSAADQTTARLSHVIYLPADADVRRGDELREGVRRFAVLAVFEPSAPGTYLRADCELTQPAA